MILKKKSFLVALVSIIVIALVLIVNLAGYLIYLEMKDNELDATYRRLLRRVNASVYSRHIEVARLGAGIEHAGPLSGKPVIEGIIRNDGTKDIADLIIKVRFLDRDGAVMYEVTFHPQDPALAAGGAVGSAAPESSELAVSLIRPESSLSFKKILTECPKEIISELKRDSAVPRGSGKWTGKLDYEIISLDH